MRLLKILRQDLENILHNPTLIFSNTVLPLILIGVMGFVTKGGFGTELVSSFDYYGVNMLIFSVGMIAITATNAFMEEQVKRGNFRIAYAPVSKQEIYLSKILSSYLLSAVCYSVLVLGCQYILGLNMGGRNCIYFIILLNVFSFCGCCFGTMFCCIFKDEEQANGIMQIPLFLSIILGGVIFQIHRFGDFLNSLSLISPVKWVAACSYQIIYDNELHLLLPVVAGLLILSLVFIGICHILFRPEDYL